MLFSVGRGKRKEQVDAKRKFSKENGGIISAGGSETQKCIQLYELRFTNTRKEGHRNLARKIGLEW